MFNLSKKQKDDVLKKELTKEEKLSKIKEINEQKNKMSLILNDCLDFFIQNNPKKIAHIHKGDSKEKNVLFKELKSFLNSKNITEVDIVEKIEEMFYNYIFGYHVLQPLIDDDDISDIKVLGKDKVRIKKIGKRYTSDVVFESDEELERFINIVAIKNEINLSDINAQQAFTDKDTSDKFRLRINISTKYINSVDHAYLHIRKIPKFKKTKEELIKAGLGTNEEFEYLEKAVREGKSIIFTGKGGSGKTTLMNYLIDEIPHDKSGLVIQENEELFSDTHPDLMFQKVKIAKGEGRVNYSLMDLSINGLLIDLDYFVIGEIKGGEAIYLLNACYTGHTCMTSVHALSSKEAVNKLVDYMKYNSDYDRKDLLKMMVSFPIVVYNKDFKIAEISEVEEFNYEKEEISYNQVFGDGVKIRKSLFE